MAKSGEFYTFDEVVRQLRIDQNKLKRLVSEGEISAFREGDVMKFKKSEIDKLVSKGTGSETSETVLSEITLEDESPAFEESGETLTDDLVFESSEDKVQIGEGQGHGEISSQDTFIEPKGGKEEEVGMSTEPIDLSADLTQEVEEEEMEEVGAGRAKSAPARGTTRRAAAEAPAGSPGITFALVLTAILIFLGAALAVRTSTNEVSSEGELAGPFKNLSGVCYDGFGSKDNVKKAIDSVVGDLRVAHTGRARPAGG
jgi:excisionase family DNA binding protein